MKICHIFLKNKTQKTFPGISLLLNTQSSDHTYRLEGEAPLLLHKVTFSTFSKSWNSPPRVLALHISMQIFKDIFNYYQVSSKLLPKECPVLLEQTFWRVLAAYSGWKEVRIFWSMYFWVTFFFLISPRNICI